MARAKTTTTEAAEAADVGQTDEQLWDKLDDEAPETSDEETGSTWRQAKGDDESEASEAPAEEAPEDGDAAEDWADEDEDDPDSSSDDEEDDAGTGDAPTPQTIEELRAQNERLEHALKSEKGRTAAGQRKLADLQRQISAAEAKGTRSKDEEARLSERRKKLEDAQDEYGDVIGPLVETVTELEARIGELTAREANDLSAKRQELADTIEAERSALADEHPDWLETVVKHRKTFDDWADDQPRRIRDIVEANRAEIFDGKATAYVVGLFKQYLLEADGLDPETAGGSDPDPSTNRLQARRERQLSGARSVRASARQQGGAGRPAKDDPDADRHWNYFEEQERREEARRG